MGSHYRLTKLGNQMFSMSMRNALNGMFLATSTIIFLNEHIQGSSIKLFTVLIYGTNTGLLKHSSLVILQTTWSLSWPVLLRLSVVFVA